LTYGNSSPKNNRNDKQLMSFKRNQTEFADG